MSMETSERVAVRACEMLSRAREREMPALWYYDNFWSNLTRLLGRTRHTPEMVNQILGICPDPEVIAQARRRLPTLCDDRDLVHAERLLDDAWVVARRRQTPADDEPPAAT